MAELSFPFPAELTRWCVQCAELCVWWDNSSGSPHQARAEGPALARCFAAEYPEGAWLCRRT